MRIDFYQLSTSTYFVLLISKLLLLGIFFFWPLGPLRSIFIWRQLKNMGVTSFQIQWEISTVIFQDYMRYSSCLSFPMIYKTIVFHTNRIPHWSFSLKTIQSMQSCCLVTQHNSKLILSFSDFSKVSQKIAKHKDLKDSCEELNGMLTNIRYHKRSNFFVKE